jgi:hypothetical protein
MSRTPDSKLFATIPDLIEYYQKNFLPIAAPNDKVVLTQPCKRPRWILKKENIQVDVNCLLGSGNFCDVYKGKLNKRRIVAIKVCHVSSVDGNYSLYNVDVCLEKKSEEQIDKEFMAREALVREGQVMQSIRHWNVISVTSFLFILIALVLRDLLRQTTSDDRDGAVSWRLSR